MKIAGLVLALGLALAPAAALRTAVAGRARAPRTCSMTGSSRAEPLALRGVARKLPDLSPAAPPAVGGHALVAAALLAAGAMPEAALAKEGAYGALEKKLPALIHPTVMATMFVVSMSAAYTGYQWRRLREVTQEVAALKTELKPLTALGVTVDTEGVETPVAPTPEQASKKRELEASIAALTETRGALAKANLRDNHWQLGSILLGLGTSFAIEGPVNTFMRAGKLFPGPHLYAGAGCVVLWAMAASLTPQMQKGSDAARLGHIGFNTAGLGLFAWQLNSGWAILSKVWEKVPW